MVAQDESVAAAAAERETQRLASVQLLDSKQDAQWKRLAEAQKVKAEVEKAEEEAEEMSTILCLAKEEVASAGSDGLSLTDLRGRLESKFGLGQSVSPEMLQRAMKGVADVAVSAAEGGEPWYAPRLAAASGESQLRTILPLQALKRGSSAGLPRGWEKRTAPDGRPYYANLLTRVTQWERPA